MADEHELEMALSLADFMRLLPLAVRGPFRVDETGTRITGGEDGLGWDIRLTELAPRRIAQLELPRLKVVLRLRAPDPAMASVWLQRFMLGYQRAGG